MFEDDIELNKYSVCKKEYFPNTFDTRIRNEFYYKKCI